MLRLSDITSFANPLTKDSIAQAKHGSQFNINAEEMQSVEDVEAFFEKPLWSKAVRERRSQTYGCDTPNLTILRFKRKGLEKNSTNGCERLKTHSASGISISKTLSRSFVKMLLFQPTSWNPSRNEPFQPTRSPLWKRTRTNCRLELYRELNNNRIEWYEHDAFGDMIGEMPADSQNQIAEWYSEMKAYLGECMAHKETVLNDLPDTPVIRDIASNSFSELTCTSL